MSAQNLVIFSAWENHGYSHKLKEYDLYVLNIHHQTNQKK